MNTTKNTLDLHLISQKSNFNGHTFSTYFLNNEEDSVIYLPNTNKINIFIGTNNSGKSRFIRELLKMEYWYLSNEFYFHLKEFNNIINFVFDTYNHNNFNYTRDLFLININYDKMNQLSNQIEGLKSKINSFIGLPQYDEIVSKFKSLIDVQRKENLKKIFIPTLRTAHSLFDGNLKKIEEDFFKQTILKNYEFRTDGQNINIFTGLHLYKEILNARNSGKTNRKKFEEFEKFISEYFFDNKEIEIVAEYDFDKNKQGKTDSNHIKIHIDGEDERNLYELGDGIQALIILMFPIFMADDETCVFIDEPEINLHPGMQRLFLNQICNNDVLKKKNLTYFISTHSNHFLDLSIEKENVSIYSFSPRKKGDKLEKQFEIKNVNQGDNTILKEIGVNNSSVFLANCSIWVEGVSDRNYIKAFLNSYINDPSNNAKLLKEDIDFAFFEYAGSNIEHYLFEQLNPEEESEIKSNINALALNNNIFLLADSDNATEESAKQTRLNNLNENTNIETYIIEDIREIENILTDEIWIKAIPFYCNKKLLDSHDVEIISTITEALQKIKPSKYKKEYIGKFLDDLRKEVNKIGNDFIINQSVYKTNKVTQTHGTFVYKRELSEFILNKEIPWNVYNKSTEIASLTKAIYNFIIKHKV
ncbi:AAA family ATPase [Flavobacterium sp. I3-2]|uniref:AAA family ATPase n=1 Tax=Flavobacterium sp. I3-2 TaxID=2748319 RepID=UPI0015B2A898|nr:AAA family ATPase [Flavobacterium sp. I3-2]